MAEDNEPARPRTGYEIGLYWRYPIVNAEGKTMSLTVELANGVVINITSCRTREIAEGIATTPPDQEMVTQATRDYLNDCFNAIAGTDDPAIQKQALALSRKQARVTR